MANINDLVSKLADARRTNYVDTIVAGVLLGTNPTSLTVLVPARIGDTIVETVDGVETSIVVTADNVAKCKVPMRKHSVTVEINGIQKQDLVLENAIPDNLGAYIGSKIMVTIRETTLDKDYTTSAGVEHKAGEIFVHIAKIALVKEQFDFMALIQQLANTGK